MATNTNKHVTLVASTVTTVTFNNKRQWVEVTVRDPGDGTQHTYFSVDGSTPTVGGDDTYVVVDARGAALKVPVKGNADPTVVKVISAGTPKVTVAGGWD